MAKSPEDYPGTVRDEKNDAPNPDGSSDLSHATNRPDDDSNIKVRGDHCLNVYVAYELKMRLKKLADKYDRTLADMIRAVLKIGIPVMEGISQAEELMVREYVELFRKFRKMKYLKEI